MSYVISRHVEGRCPDIRALRKPAHAEGHAFVEPTKQEWRSGVNRFDEPGECFFLARRFGQVVGMCGVNVDPYSGDPDVGRLRRLYVHPSHRGQGLARGLVAECLSEVEGRFERIRLRTSNPAADTLYQGIGFHIVKEADPTHSTSA